MKRALGSAFSSQLAELQRGDAFGVFIDDTGSPGHVSPGLHAQRKSWVAVVVPPSQTREVLEQLPNALNVVREMCPNAMEFHFTDIYSGKGAFANVALQPRLAVFQFMAWVFASYKFPVFVQTLDPDNCQELLAWANWPKTIGPLKSLNHQDLALILLLIRVRLYLKESFGSEASARVFVDEGRLKNGACISLSGFSPLFRDGMVSFADSKAVPPLQLADFAAFSMNRMQLLRVKKSLSALDKQMLAILSPLAPCFQNIELVHIDLAAINSFSEGIVGRDASHLKR